jgi:hypothetical protein
MKLNKNEIINAAAYLIVQAFIVGIKANDIKSLLHNVVFGFAIVFKVPVNNGHIRISSFAEIDSSFFSLFSASVLVSVAIFLCVLLIRVLYKRILSLVLVKKWVRLIKENGLVNVTAFYFIQTFAFGTFIIFGCLSEYTSQHRLHLAIFFALWLITSILAYSVVFLYITLSPNLFKQKIFASLPKKNAVINTVLYILSFLLIIKLLAYQTTPKNAVLILISALIWDFIISIFSEQKTFASLPPKNTVLYILSFLLIIKLLVIPIVYQTTPKNAALLFISALVWSFIISIFSTPIIKGIRFPARRLMELLKRHCAMNIVSYTFIQAFMVGLSMAIGYNSIKWIEYGMGNPGTIGLFALAFFHSVLFSLIILLCVLAVRIFLKKSASLLLRIVIRKGKKSESGKPAFEKSIGGKYL